MESDGKDKLIEKFMEGGGVENARMREMRS
jgi:hypothetical protein